MKIGAKIAVIFIIGVFFLLWYAGGSLFVACLICVPAVLFSGVFTDEKNYDYYIHSSGNLEPEVDEDEAELAGLEAEEQNELASPFNYFELDENCSQKELETAFKRMIRQYHPDKTEGLGPELRELAGKKTQEIISNYKKCSEILRSKKSA